MSDQVLSRFTPDTQEEAGYSRARILKFGIVDTGWTTEAYVESIQKCPDIKIIVVAKVIPGKAERSLEKFGMEGVHLYGDHRVMLEAEKDLDAVCVCTYDTQHAVCTIDVLSIGINVILEKPMIATLGRAVQVVRAEKTSDKLLSIGSQPRMDVNMQMIHRIVQSGGFGKVCYIQTGGGHRRGIPSSTFIEKKTAGIDAFGNIGCYSLDMMFSAVDYPKPLTVSGYTSSYFGANSNHNTPEDAARFDMDDFTATFIRLEGGIIIDLHIVWAMCVDTPGDTITFGTEGALHIPPTECQNGAVSDPMKLYKNIIGKRVETEIPIETEVKNARGLFYRKMRLFADAVRNGGGTPVPSDQILLNQAVLNGTIRSAKTGREVETEFPKDV